MLRLIGLLFVLVANSLRAEPFSIKLLEGPRKDGLPQDWQFQFFPKIKEHSVYEIAEEGGALVVHARAQASASGLILRRRIDLKETPILRWRWKVLRLPKGENPRKKSGDDYGARLYVVFEKPWKELSFLSKQKANLAKVIYGERPPTAAINYIWSGYLKRGENAPNPYTDAVRMLAVRGKEDAPGQWLSEERHLIEDYRLLFGEEPPLVTGISLMTDADNTKSDAEAYYADLEIGR